MATRRKLDSYLATHSYLGSDVCATLLDYEMCESLKQDADTCLAEFPHLRRWKSHITFLKLKYSGLDHLGQQLQFGVFFLKNEYALCESNALSTYNRVFIGTPTAFEQKVEWSTEDIDLVVIRSLGTLI